MATERYRASEHTGHPCCWKASVEDTSDLDSDGDPSTVYDAYVHWRHLATYQSLGKAHAAIVRAGCTMNRAGAAVIKRTPAMYSRAARTLPTKTAP